MKAYKLSVKAIILDAQNRCLLLKRSQRAPNWPGKWDLPGGKLDEGETFVTGLTREICEETGWKLQGDDIVRLAGATEFETNSARTVLVCMVAKPGNEPIRLSPEHVEVCWMTAQEALSLDLVDHVRVILGAFKG